MTSGNMICPGCKAFQPRAETCRECGAVVAKLWSREPPPQGPLRRPARRHIRRPSAPALAAGALLAVCVGYGLWSLSGDDRPVTADDTPRSPLGEYLEAARDAQHAAELTRERMELAVLEAETGAGGALAAIHPPIVDLADLGLDRLAAEMNAVGDTMPVALTGADLAPTVRRCARDVRRHFKPLRFGAAQPYPLPQPETAPYVPGGLDGRYRCEGDDGTVYTNNRPRSANGIAACWEKVKPLRGQRRGQDRERTTQWVRMQWDGEAGHWAIYTRADQRTVDAARLPAVRREVADDIARRHERREARARERIPALTATIADLREKLAITASEQRRRQHTLALDDAERQLRTALVERRYQWLCGTAASAALDDLQRHLDGR